MTNIHHAVEIGAGDRYSSQLLSLAPSIPRTQFVEPNSLLANDLSEALRGVAGSVVHLAAVGPKHGTADLIHMGYASYVVGAPSFLNTSVETEEYWKPLVKVVPMMTMGQLERELPIDWLCLTCNGMEMVALEGMASRPVVIRTKAYLHNPRQVAEWGRLVSWMDSNGYRGVLLESNQHSTFQSVEWTWQPRVLPIRRESR